MKTVLMRLACAVLWAFLLSGTLHAQAPAKVEFARDVQPILKQHCVECHGPSQQMRGLRLDRRRDAMPNRVGANGARIVPGNSAASPLYRRLTGNESGRADAAGRAVAARSRSTSSRRGSIRAPMAGRAVGRDGHDAARSGGRQDDATPFATAIARQFDRAMRENPQVRERQRAGGWTPIMYAALYGDAEDVRHLLAQGADPNAQNDGGGTALMYAVEDAEKTRLLLDRGADANARSGEGRTALLSPWAVRIERRRDRFFWKGERARRRGFRMAGARCNLPSPPVTPHCCHCCWITARAGRRFRSALRCWLAAPPVSTCCSRSPSPPISTPR